MSACYPQHYRCIASRFPKLWGGPRVTITKRVWVNHNKKKESGVKRNLHPNKNIIYYLSKMGNHLKSLSSEKNTKKQKNNFLGTLKQDEIILRGHIYNYTFFVFRHDFNQERQVSEVQINI